MIKKDQFREQHSYKKGMLILFKDKVGPSKNKPGRVAVVINDILMNGISHVALGGRYWYRVFFEDKVHVVPADYATRV
mgnify:FL=1